MSPKRGIREANLELTKLDSAHPTLAARVLRFVIVGGINTAIGYGTYAFFLFLGFPYAVANFLAMIVGVLISFKSQGTFVFQNPDNRLFAKFLAFWGIMYFVNIALIGVFLSWGFNAYEAGALAVPLVATLSFFVQSTLIFKRYGKAGVGIESGDGTAVSGKGSGDGE
jgi:putative flippase GtrA